MQRVPASVSLTYHGLQMTGPVCAVLSDQATVLVVDDFQLSQPLMDLSLEALPRAEIKDLEFSNSSVSRFLQRCYIFTAK